MFTIGFIESAAIAVPLVLGEPTRHEVGDELVEMTLISFCTGRSPCRWRSGDKACS
jgi:hypothetical protein